MQRFHFIALLLSASFAWTASAASLTVLTDRPKERMDKVLAAFMQKTGIATELVSAPYSDLKTKIKNGEAADVMLLKDIEHLALAAREDLFQSLNAENRRANVAAHMRDSRGLWTALTYRIRTFVYDPSVIEARSLTTYEALGGRSFTGQLCIRNSKDYMPTMVAWMIVRFGEAKALAMLEGWKANLAIPFTTSDTDSLKKIESGACTAAISNHYYLARLKNADQRFPAEIAFADQLEGGLHSNGFGGGLVKGTRQASNANALMAFLLSPEGQRILVENPSFEYPAVKTLKPVELVENFGTFKSSVVSWSEVGNQVSKARELLDRVGWAK